MSGVALTGALNDALCGVAVALGMPLTVIASRSLQKRAVAFARDRAVASAGPANDNTNARQSALAPDRRARCPR